jgi:hypothetical protein
MGRPSKLSPEPAIEKNQRKSKESNARGGKRPGSGRKKGSATKRTREIADRAAEEGITPLEFMLNVMRAPSDHDDPKVVIARESLRFEAAKAAAPYMHPRLAAVEHTGADGKDLMPPAPIFQVTLTKE